MTDESRFGTTTIKIILEDANDEIPYFEDEPYQVAIKENIEVGDVIDVQIKVKDDDDSPEFGTQSIV